MKYGLNTHNRQKYSTDMVWYMTRVTLCIQYCGVIILSQLWLVSKRHISQRVYELKLKSWEYSFTCDYDFCDLIRSILTDLSLKTDVYVSEMWSFLYRKCCILLVSIGYFNQCCFFIMIRSVRKMIFENEKFRYCHTWQFAYKLTS